MGGMPIGGTPIGGIVTGPMTIGGVVIGGMTTGGVPPPGAAPPPGGMVAQFGRVMVLLSRVTAPLRARTRPFTVVPVCTVPEVNASMLPTKVVLVPRVAELPTCQNTCRVMPR